MTKLLLSYGVVLDVVSQLYNQQLRVAEPSSGGQPPSKLTIGGSSTSFKTMEMVRLPTKSAKRGSQTSHKDDGDYGVVDRPKAG